MTVRVILPTALRTRARGEDEIRLRARTVGEALRELARAFPDLKSELFAEDGRLRSSINVYLNEEDVSRKDGEGTPMRDGDALIVVPEVAGGGRGPAFSSDEIARYSRHLIMPEVGLEGQARLKSSSALVVGVGGLGTPCSTYLAAAGVGRIGIVDFDAVEKSNLHRQVLYSERDVGKSKAETARRRLLEVNPNVSVEAHNVRLDSTNALDILARYDVVLDGSDNFPTRYLVNDACVLLGKPNVYASVFRFEGQASVFHAKEGPCYRCLYPEPPPPGQVPSCSEGGVLGVLPGIMGSIQAAEAIDLILGRGRPLVGRLLTFDALEMAFREFKLRKNPRCSVCGPHPTVTTLVDYEAFCGVGEEQTPGGEVTSRELEELMARGKGVVVLDVREPWEHEINRIPGSRLIPLDELPGRVNELSTADDIVVACLSGRRSAEATRLLNGMGFRKARNLRGGMRAWVSEVHPELPTY